MTTPNPRGCVRNTFWDNAKTFGVNLKREAHWSYDETRRARKRAGNRRPRVTLEDAMRALLAQGKK